MSQLSRSERSTSPGIRVIDSCVSRQIGGNRKESTTEFDGDSRVKLSCHRYVFKRRPEHIEAFRPDVDWLMTRAMSKVADGFLC